MARAKQRCYALSWGLPKPPARSCLTGSPSTRCTRPNALALGSAMRPRTGGCSRPSRSRKTSCCPRRPRGWTRRKPKSGWTGPTVLPELRELAGRPGGTVAGGQGEMVALARALMLGTKLIMLDKPFQGLAPALAQRYAEALRTLRDADRSVTLLITESNPSLLRGFADRTLVIERGEIEEGSLEPEGTHA